MVRNKKANVRAMKTSRTAMLVFNGGNCHVRREEDPGQQVQSKGALDRESALEVDEEVHTNPKRTVRRKRECPKSVLSHELPHTGRELRGATVDECQ